MVELVALLKSSPCLNALTQCVAFTCFSLSDFCKGQLAFEGLRDMESYHPVVLLFKTEFSRLSANGK